MTVEHRSIDEAAVTDRAFVERRAFDPDGAVFVSYRQADGSEIADQVAWALRGCGLPVWRDQQDLLPGDFTERISQAFDDGVSAAVIVVTPDIVNSQVVRDVEVPRLLELHALEPRFSLAVLNGVTGPDGKLDFSAPDALLGLLDAPLRGTKQYESHREGIARLAVEMARRRMIEFSRAGRTVLPLDIQSRSAPQATDARPGLVVRLRPAVNAARIPPVDALQNLRTFLSICPQLLGASGASQVEVTGGAHLSVAFGLGVALPRVRQTAVTIVDPVGRWSSEVEDATDDDSQVSVDVEDVSPGRGRLAVYVDIAEHRGDSAAFEQWLIENRERVHRRLVLRGSGERMECQAGQQIAESIEAAIRDNALPLGHSDVDLFLRSSFPVAVLLGRLLNTLKVTTYEWNNVTAPPSYVPVATYEYGTNPLAAIVGEP